ncbi:MAG: UDP-N-acetylmuramate--L-alanine ligase [Actinomycetota bacterium]|nr:UDP-N-acetylmuramate--L-alanine ligase [Actinomycetota bacterium]
MSISINTFKSCYIVGIGGSGMSSIAKYLFQKGLEVSGYDQRSSYITNLLNNDGVKVDFDISNATYSSEILYIVSSAINMESTFLSDFVKQPNVLTRPDFLKLLSGSVDVIGITGTHGKTSTTALLAHIFKFNDIDISYIYGGVTSFNGIGGHYGDKNLPLILETDEAFNTFKDIQIKNLLVTNIDHDHIDYFGSFENLIKAFKHVISNVEGKCVINIDDDQLSKLIRAEDISYSSSKDSNYKLNSYSSFLYKGNKFKIKTKLIGDHFISNIIGAVALANLNGLSIEQSLNAIEHFAGVKRRTEFIGEFNGINFYDDYGHHPTEIKATTRALKEHTQGKLIVVFQPHRYTRTRDNFNDLSKSFEYSDLTLITDIYSAGEKPIPGVSSLMFESEKIKYVKSPRMVPTYLKNKISPGDIVLTIGAGDITLLGPQILKYLNEN